MTHLTSPSSIQNPTFKIPISHSHLMGESVSNELVSNCFLKCDTWPYLLDSSGVNVCYLGPSGREGHLRQISGPDPVLDVTRAIFTRRNSVL
jgi:hypothetical protein